MIKETEILVNITIRNTTHYKELGYEVKEKKIAVNPYDIPKGSHARITAICEICDSETSISICKYYVNKERNDKGFYSCFGCKTIENEKTCLKKYGTKTYSQTKEFKNIDKSDYDYHTRVEKGKKTKLERYGVDSWFKLDIMKEQNRLWMSSEEFKEKSKATLIGKYGVDSFSKTDEFKNIIFDKKEETNEKIRNTCLERYGFISYFMTNEYKEYFKANLSQMLEKTKNTCLERYGVENVSQVKEIYNKILNSKKASGLIPPDSLLSSWVVYKKRCRTLTGKVKKLLYEKWDGYDYYDGEFIKEYSLFKHTDRLYPTVDHKISLLFGFSNGISAEEICDISNLCITKRWINCSKNSLTEDIFKLK